MKHFVETFLTGPKRTKLAKARHSPDGYIFTRNAAKPGQVLAFPKSCDMKDYPCLVFDTTGKHGKFKAFQVRDGG